MNFSKIAATAKHVALKWVTMEGHAEISHELESDEAPRPEFVKALEALDEHLLSICELDEDWAEDLTVTGLTISKNAKSGRRGLVVTGRRTVGQSNSPFVIHSPIVFETVADEDEDTGDAAFPIDGIAEALATVEAHATEYLGGARAQIDIFEQGAAPAPALDIAVGNGGQPGDRSIARKRGKGKKAAESAYIEVDTPDYEIVDDDAPAPRLDEVGVDAIKQAALRGA